MRLIDADKIPFLSIPVAPVMTTDTDVVFRAGAFKEDVDRVPTIDTVKHAHWVRVARSENEYWQCSNCHGYFTLPMPKYRGFYMRYCGCCGAEMDEVIE